MSKKELLRIIAGSLGYPRTPCLIGHDSVCVLTPKKCITKKKMTVDLAVAPYIVKNLNLEVSGPFFLKSNSKRWSDDCPIAVGWKVKIVTAKNLKR